jgi:hypothetical protein
VSARFAADPGEALVNLDSLDGLSSSDEVRVQGPAPYQGADATDSVKVTVDARARMINVDVSDGWRERVGVTDFADALFDAYTAAVRKALTAAAVTALAGVPEQRPSQPPSMKEYTGSDVDWLRAKQTTLDRVHAELSRLATVDTAGAGREWTLSSPHGYLTLRLLGRSLAGIHGDVRRIARAGAAQLRFDALAAFRAAALTSETDPADEAYHV